MGADYSFYVKSIATYAPTFFGYNNSVLAIVIPTKKVVQIDLLSLISHIFDNAQFSSQVVVTIVGQAMQTAAFICKKDACRADTKYFARNPVKNQSRQGKNLKHFKWWNCFSHINFCHSRKKWLLHCSIAL